MKKQKPKRNFNNIINNNNRTKNIDAIIIDKEEIKKKKEELSKINDEISLNKGKMNKWNQIYINK